MYPAAPPAPIFRPELAGAQRPSRPPPPQDTAAFNTAMLQPPISFHLPGVLGGICTFAGSMGEKLLAFIQRIFCLELLFNTK